MAWATPPTFTTGVVVTANDLNILRDDLRHLKGLDGTVAIDDSVLMSKSGSGGNGAVLDLRNTHASGIFTGGINFTNNSGQTSGLVYSFVRGSTYGGGLRLTGNDGSTPGHMVVWGASAIAGTPIVAIPLGVSRRWYAVGVVRLSTGVTANIGIGSAANGVGNNLYADGTNTLIAVDASGALQVYRTTGSVTFDVVMSIWYQ